MITTLTVRMDKRCQQKHAHCQVWIVEPEIKFDVPLGAGASRGVQLASLMTVTASLAYSHTDEQRQCDKAKQPGRTPASPKQPTSSVRE